MRIDQSNTQNNFVLSIESFWNNGMSYNNYKDVIHELALNHTTSGDDKTEERIKFTALNEYRMNRVEKTFTAIEELQKELELLDFPLMCLVITESWCGDSAQIVPALQKIADASKGKINLRLVFRDENPELMNEFLTNGSRSVPKMIVLDEHFNVITTWGPRPEKAQQLVMVLKSNPQTAATFKEELQKWYAKDRSVNIELEIASLLHNIQIRMQLLKAQ